MSIEQLIWLGLFLLTFVTLISYVFTMKAWPGETETFMGEISDKDETKITVYTV